MQNQWNPFFACLTDIIPVKPLHLRHPSTLRMLLSGPFRYMPNRMAYVLEDIDSLFHPITSLTISINASTLVAVCALLVITWSLCRLRKGILDALSFFSRNRDSPPQMSQYCIFSKIIPSTLKLWTISFISANRESC